jgi:hypothetical protein
MKLLKNILLISLVTFFLSCEKVIDVNLNTAEPKLVIEGNITSELGPYEVILTTSGGYFDNSAVQPVENAFIQISSEDGNIETLSEVSPGKYVTENFTGIENSSYNLLVEVEGETYTASESLPSKVKIDTLAYEETNFGPPPDEQGKNISLLCTFTDPGEIENYYRFIIYKNGERTDGIFNPYLVTDDLLINGRTFTAGLPLIRILPGDIIKLELHTIGFNTFQYFNSLNDALEGGGMGSTPYNPITNFDNGALGYFGAYTISSDSIVIQ